MINLSGVASQLLISKLVSNETPVSRTRKIGMNYIFISGFFIALGLAILLYAGYVHLNKEYSQEVALMFVGVGALLIAVLNACCAYLYYRFKRHQVMKTKDEIIDVIESALNEIDQEIAEPIRQNPKSSAAIALIAGFMAGERFL